MGGQRNTGEEGGRERASRGQLTPSHQGPQAWAEKERHSKRRGQQRQRHEVREPSVAGGTQVSRGGSVNAEARTDSQRQPSRGIWTGS